MKVRFETEWRQCNMLPVLWFFYDPITGAYAIQLALFVWSINFVSNEYII